MSDMPGSNLALLSGHADGRFLSAPSLSACCSCLSSVQEAVVDLKRSCEHNEIAKQLFVEEAVHRMALPGGCKLAAYSIISKTYSLAKNSPRPTFSLPV